MSHEYNRQNFEMFSEDELEVFVNKICAFNEKRGTAMDLESVDVDGMGRITSILSAEMPSYKIGKRSIAIIPPDGYGQTSVTLTDFLYNEDSNTGFLIGRQINLDSSRFDQFEYQCGLNISYTEYPANKEGLPILPSDWTEATQKPNFLPRPFTHGDYHDMLTMLDSGVSS